MLTQKNLVPQNRPFLSLTKLFNHGWVEQSQSGWAVPVVVVVRFFSTPSDTFIRLLCTVFTNESRQINIGGGGCKQQSASNIGWVCWVAPAAAVGEGLYEHKIIPQSLVKCSWNLRALHAFVTWIFAMLLRDGGGYWDFTSLPYPFPTLPPTDCEKRIVMLR